MQKLFKLITLGLTFLAFSANAIEFKDQENKIVKLKQPAQRVITIPIPLASLTISIDEGTDRLVAVHPRAKQAIVGKLLGKMFPKSNNLNTKAMGNDFYPNIEEVLRLKADLVFQWSTMGERIVEPLKKANINTVLIKYGQESHVLEWFDIIGKAYGKEKRVKDMVEYRTKVKDKLMQQKFSKKPKVLYFLRFNKTFKVAGDNTFNKYSIELAGGQSIGGFTGFKILNAEEVLRYNPEIILLNNFEDDLSPKDVYAHPLLSKTLAAKNKRVYKMPLGGYRWDPPSQESPLMWMWMSKIFHGDKVKFNLVDEMKSAYKSLYNYQLDNKSIEKILWFDRNAKSQNYTKLFKTK